jgi:hypothetical protein
MLSVYTTLLTLQPRHNLGDFFALLDSSPRLKTARKLLEIYARSQNREMLRDFYYADDRRVESAILALEEAAGMTVGVAEHPLILTNCSQPLGYIGEDHICQISPEVLQRGPRSRI